MRKQDLIRVGSYPNHEYPAHDKFIKGTIYR